MGTHQRAAAGARHGVSVPRPTSPWCRLAGVWLLQLLAVFALAQPRVVINEIHFDPPEKKPLEFIELHNAGDAPAHLLGWQLEKFKFPETTLAPGGFVVVAQDPVAFQKAYGFAPLGPLPGKLKNNGERITLRDAGGQLVDELRYGAGFPWPTASVGAGSSLERVHPALPGKWPGSWRASGFRVEGGSVNKPPTPGKTNSVFTTQIPPAVEAVAHTPQQPRVSASRTVTVTDSPARGC
ncbi:MAG: lamin tail domain-containing protein, partial [Verrucomicrobia bacterium]|nr:lamin tail domain-containing protein [Verrucomicrobiota bacterium]